MLVLQVLLPLRLLSVRALLWHIIKHVSLHCPCRRICACVSLSALPAELLAGCPSADAGVASAAATAPVSVFSLSWHIIGHVSSHCPRRMICACVSVCAFPAELLAGRPSADAGRPQLPAALPAAGAGVCHALCPLSEPGWLCGPCSSPQAGDGEHSLSIQRQAWRAYLQVAVSRGRPAAPHSSSQCAEPPPALLLPT